MEAYYSKPSKPPSCTASLDTSIPPVLCCTRSQYCLTRHTQVALYCFLVYQTSWHCDSDSSRYWRLYISDLQSESIRAVQSTNVEFFKITRMNGNSTSGFSGPLVSLHGCVHGIMRVNVADNKKFSGRCDRWHNIVSFILFLMSSPEFSDPGQRGWPVVYIFIALSSTNSAFRRATSGYDRNGTLDSELVFGVLFRS
ncbi:hypothetical protein BT63DRAFT_194188 [Microthyrium microscopicum]|uniref:Uncharacterized protein n=1 Tax=Microthyrium microscopicum TaxID=703497 RepID=A0A6A6UJF0_9PEZI|nr:hypothetical protein BT63DRAFT_194188 [Microthyrium microscopicum]